ncbi:hypothetical protein EJP02_402 [Escherichia phage EJP2]|nr:hypothetical protein EJP02_402 [Escherichia phage EJP2]
MKFFERIVASIKAYLGNNNTGPGELECWRDWDKRMDSIVPAAHPKTYDRYDPKYNLHEKIEKDS